MVGSWLAQQWNIFQCWLTFEDFLQAIFSVVTTKSYSHFIRTFFSTILWIIHLSSREKTLEMKAKSSLGQTALFTWNWATHKKTKKIQLSQNFATKQLHTLQWIIAGDLLRLLLRTDPRLQLMFWNSLLIEPRRFECTFNVHAQTDKHFSIGIETVKTRLLFMGHFVC